MRSTICSAAAPASPRSVLLEPGLAEGLVPGVEGLHDAVREDEEPVARLQARCSVVYSLSANTPRGRPRPPAMARDRLPEAGDRAGCGRR